MKYLAVLVAVGFGLARLLMPVKSEIHHEDIFKDMAHLVVGLLYGYGLHSWCDYSPWYAYGNKWQWLKAWWRCRTQPYLYLAIILTILEVIAFKLHK